MHILDDITPALTMILREWSRNNVSCWTSFKVDKSKLEGISQKWIENYGTKLSREKRRYRKSKGLPRANAYALPVLGEPHKVECILMASEEALSATVGPFSQEKWIARPPEVSDFVMKKEAKERGDSTWTWKIQNKQMGMLEADLIATVKTNKPYEVKKVAEHMVRFYPMFGGVRRQLRRALQSAAKLWRATAKSEFPGPEPDSLPTMGGYKKT